MFTAARKKTQAVESNVRDFPEFMERVTSARGLRMKDRHDPLYARYKSEPDAARIRDGARTSCATVPTDSPIHTEVSFGVNNPISLPVGIHTAVGGDSDFPNPGDILCGAIAGCLDSTIRIMASRVGVKLKHLHVDVTGHVDVRGTLRAAKNVPVGFQRFEVSVSIKPSGFVPGKMLDKLIRAAEQSCVVIQSLRNCPEIDVSRG